MSGLRLGFGGRARVGARLGRMCFVRRACIGAGVRRGGLREGPVWGWGWAWRPAEGLDEATPLLSFIAVADLVRARARVRVRVRVTVTVRVRVRVRVRCVKVRG